MAHIRIEKNIETCKECPGVHISENLNGTQDYFCGEAHDELLAAQVEYASEVPSVPWWCPHRVDVKTCKPKYKVGDKVYFIQAFVGSLHPFKYQVVTDEITGIFGSAQKGWTYQTRFLHGEGFAVDEDELYSNEAAAAHAMEQLLTARRG